jgi:N,N-dimethylformamidase
VKGNKVSEATPDGSSVLAYSDRLTYLQGESVELKATGDGLVELDMVRLRHPPDDPTWTTPCFSPVDSVPSQRVQLTPQETFGGSYMAASGVPLGAGPVGGSVYVLPTQLDAGRIQGLWSLNETKGRGGVAIVVGADGALALVWSSSTGTEHRLSSPIQMIEGHWQVVSWSMNRSTGEVSLAHRLVRPGPAGVGSWSGSRQIEDIEALRLSEVLIGAARVGAASTASSLPGTPSHQSSFNGKIDGPVLVAAPIATETLGRMTPEELRQAGPLVACWDFSQEQSTTRVRDLGTHGCNGVLVNSPARAMTGVHWQGDEQNWIHAPQQYSAVYFHDDDLDDARWPVSAVIELPENLPTGVYGIRVREVGEDDLDQYEMVTLIVVPRQRSAGVQTLVVLPTYTYIAYANLLGNGDDTDYIKAGLAEGDVAPHAGMQRLARFPVIGGSLYDVHNDGSGRCYSSPRRPILNLRLDWKSARRDAYRHMAADLYIIDWLESLGVPYHVTTDHMLNKLGTGALEGYSTVLTGSHPEYVSRAIIDALQSHLDAGGSLLYLGGNGFYWVATESTEILEMLEVRRGFTGTRTWTGAAGESHHSMTGELGGLWRHRGLAPNRLVGVGFAAQGADGGAAGYRRASDALQTKAAFLFEGVEAEVFGTTGFDMGGAAGDEVDRFSVEAGSAPWGTVVASSLELSKFYKLAIEDIQISRENVGGDHEAAVRADLVLTEHAAGGFVFAVGSISWVQSMAVGEYTNDVARITENALRAANGRASSVKVN